jgi:mannose-6-phosphate isomerase-like protein (cupin superfamily)
MKIIRDYVKSRVTWDDAIKKIDLDAGQDSDTALIVIIRDDNMLPSLQLKHGDLSSFPGAFQDAMDELNPETMDVYISFSKISKIFPLHTDPYDVIITQMLGEISYAFEDQSTHTLYPGDSIFIPAFVPHRAILHGPRITLSCT